MITTIMIKTILAINIIIIVIVIINAIIICIIHISFLESSSRFLPLLSPPNEKVTFSPSILSRLPFFPINNSVLCFNSPFPFLCSPLLPLLRQPFLPSPAIIPFSCTLTGSPQSPYYSIYMDASHQSAPYNYGYWSLLWERVYEDWIYIAECKWTWERYVRGTE